MGCDGNLLLHFRMDEESQRLIAMIYKLLTIATFVKGERAIRLDISG